MAKHEAFQVKNTLYNSFSNNLIQIMFALDYAFICFQVFLDVAF